MSGLIHASVFAVDVGISVCTFWVLITHNLSFFSPVLVFVFVFLVSDPLKTYSQAAAAAVAVKDAADKSKSSFGAFIAQAQKKAGIKGSKK